jgi:F-type H+-transporting ATPase subunit gamma
VARIADELITRYITGQVDRVDVAYTKFISSSKQIPIVETLLPFAGIEVPAGNSAPKDGEKPSSEKKLKDDYEFLPSAAGILEEVVPASFRARLFKCFLDAAVSEQIARMVAMKSATENAGDLIKSLSRTFNRARQSKITQEIMEIIGGVEALG